MKRTGLSDTYLSDYYSATGDKLGVPVDATGGTITIAGGYRIHTFTSSGVFSVISGCNVKYLVVAGGGGGAAGCGNGNGTGGAGAGGMLEGEALVAEGAITITVGNGGVGGTTNIGTNQGGSDGSQGGNSSFGEFVAIGGGRGSKYSSSGAVGGSGSGGGGNNSGGNGTQYQGNSGGAGLGSAFPYRGGGGGGAGGIGATGTASGNGGLGKVSSIT